MPGHAKYTAEQWAEAHRLRAEGMAFPDIAERAGFRAWKTIARRASTEGWRSSSNVKLRAARKAAARRALAKPRSVPRTRLAPATVRSHDALVLRLYGCFDLQLRTLELNMKTKLHTYAQAPDAADPPTITKEENAQLAVLIDNINKVTEMASAPASAADGGRKSASINPELAVLSDDLEPDALAAASEKDNFRREIADKLEKLVPPA